VSWVRWLCGRGTEAAIRGYSQLEWSSVAAAPRLHLDEAAFETVVLLARGSSAPVTASSNSTGLALGGLSWICIACVRSVHDMQRHSRGSGVHDMHSQHAPQRVVALPLCIVRSGLLHHAPAVYRSLKCGDEVCNLCVSLRHLDNFPVATVCL
jgi:hypothetical protein